MSSLTCRLCDATVDVTFADLGVQPLANSYIDPARIDEVEPTFPLHARVCRQCLLVQLPVFQAPGEIFGDYAYFSSYSESWLEHSRRYVMQAIAQHRLKPSSLVVELASNDGYLLQYFVEAGIPVLGVEPAANIVAAAQKRGVRTLNAFFGRETADSILETHGAADLIVANNVLAHVPDLHDFVGGIQRLMAPEGSLSVEVPHLLRLIDGRQFDTIYHEHFSYFSLIVLERVFQRHGLQVVDVEQIPTHGGSLRLTVRRSGAAQATERVQAVLDQELAAGLDNLETYTRFGSLVEETKHRLLALLISARDRGKRVVAYGAPAKGNTLLNYCGVGTDLIEFTVDRSPHKQGTLLPGTRIPVFSPDHLIEARPDYVLILPWNLADEIVSQMRAVRDWGGRFVIPVPVATILA